MSGFGPATHWPLRGRCRPGAERPALLRLWQAGPPPPCAVRWELSPSPGPACFGRPGGASAHRPAGSHAGAAASLTPTRAFALTRHWLGAAWAVAAVIRGPGTTRLLLYFFLAREAFRRPLPPLGPQPPLFCCWAFFGAMEAAARLWTGGYIHTCMHACIHTYIHTFCPSLDSLWVCIV